MGSTKAQALDDCCRADGRALLRFDYSGHGESGGRFEDGTITRWLEETLAVIRAASAGPLVLVGSSMGGYLALLAARELARAGEAARLAGMALIAPAVDFTEALIWAAGARGGAAGDPGDGRLARAPRPIRRSPMCITRALIEDGRRHLLLDDTIRTHCPLRILQGMRDADVP